MKDIQIVFSNETKIIELDKNEFNIEKSVFNFYDLADLKELTTQTTYLADIIGVIQDPNLIISRFTNKLHQQQSQMKFYIFDGNTYVRVTLWDAFAEQFHETLMEDFEKSFIVIIICARITLWQNEVDVSNIGPTSYYFNSNHHSAVHLRNELKFPQFADIMNVKKLAEPTRTLTVAKINQLGEEDIEVRTATACL
ncbi:uncharacterized protein LOC141682900 [Apium graveolens]|uniref:uncharacterized protein LOC141682900 n=1 Tax=Apium graveolens TaxID=4045 RepID=UPI003D7BCE70